MKKRPFTQGPGNPAYEARFKKAGWPWNEKRSQIRKPRGYKLGGSPRGYEITRTTGVVVTHKPLPTRKKQGGF